MLFFSRRALTADIFSQARFCDRRGYFQELFHNGKYPAHVCPNELAQVSLSSSRRGVLRGLHCSPYPKLVSVVRGAIYDVVVDLRPDSPTFRRWCAVYVNSDNRRQIYVPPGCGHGFVCVEDAEMLYLQGGTFVSQTEIDVHPFDATLDIKWHDFGDDMEYIMSDKDMAAPKFLEKFATIGRDISPLRRVLIIGASGQVGGALAEAFGSHNIIGTFSKTPVDGFVRFDLGDAALDPQLAVDLITLCHPQIVCICAGRTWVDGCENDGDLPHRVNCLGPRAVVRAAKLFGAKTVYYSTDYIFDGSVDGKRYFEEDVPAPLNIYGATKLSGERAVLEEDESCLVLRTTGVFGPELQGKNFVYQLCNAVNARRSLQCAADNFGTPTYNRDLALMTIGLLDGNKTGVYHCVGNETMDRYSFALMVAKELNIDESFIEKVDSDTLYESTKARIGFAAKRGKYLGLQNGKTLSDLPPKYHPRSILQALQDWKLNPRGAVLKK